MRPSHWSGAQQQPKAPHQPLPNNHHLQHSHQSPSSSTAVQQQPQIGRQSVRQRHESGCAQGASPPAVVLFPDAPNGSVPGGMANNRLPNRPGGQSDAFLVRNPSVDIQSPGDPDFLAGHKSAVQPTSRSPSASSLASTGGTLTTTTNNNTLGNCSPHHCSPNPSPPPGGVPQPPPATQPRIGPTRVQTAGSASVARMMSALLKQQNSIAEEEPDLELPNGQVPSGTPPATAAASNSDERQQKCWLAPPDHTLLGGNISPPPTRIHPLQDPELRKEIPIVHQSGHSQNNSQSMANELGHHIVAMATPIAAAPALPSAASIHHHHQQQQQQVQREREDGGSTRGWSRQQSQPWHTGRGATNKHRKGSLSPNNSLRYSTLMAAATRRNHFQQQRTTSEATPAQRDQLMADVLGHGIREQCICASVSAPSPRLMASSVGVACCSSDHNGTNSTTTSHHSCSLRFELGGGDSSASSLNGHPPGGGHCSQCSSANSLQRAGSIRQRPVPRGRLHTADGGYSSDPPHNPHHEGRCSPASGSLPKLVSLVPPSFPPASSMLSSSDSEQNREFAKKRQKEGGERSPSRVAEWHAKVPKLSTDEEPTNNNNNNGTSADANANKVTLANGGHRLCPPPSISAAAAVLRRDPARWNLAATKQRSSSESAFNVMPKLAIDCGQGDGQCACCVCTCAACQQIPTIGDKCGEQQRASFAMESSSNACRSCPHGQASVVGQGTAMRRPDSMSALSSQPRHRPGCTTIAFLQHRRRFPLHCWPEPREDGCQIHFENPDDHMSGHCADAVHGHPLDDRRHHDMEADDMISVQAEKHQSYLNSLWLIAVTFLSIGYGDIVPNTQCGRIMAVVTGILGTCTSSMVVAVIARKLELTRAEKHVHNFMIETQHTKEMKHIAANVLRETWLIYKNRRLVEKIDPSKIRYHQRKFLVAICSLRKLKTSQRKLDENRISLGDVAKTTSHSHELMRDVHTTQEGMALRITAVEHQLSDIQRELSGISELLKFAMRPQIEHGCAVPATPQTPAAQQPQPAAPSLMMVSGQQSPVENLRLQQRRKPSTISEPPS